MPHLLRYGDLVFPVSAEGPPHFVASYYTQGDVENLSNPDPHRSSLRESFPMKLNNFHVRN
jgi:hypothetical protein